MTKYTELFLEEQYELMEIIEESEYPFAEKAAAKVSLMLDEICSRCFRIHYNCICGDDHDNA